MNVAAALRLLVWISVTTLCVACQPRLAAPDQTVSQSARLQRIEAPAPLRSTANVGSNAANRASKPAAPLNAIHPPMAPVRDVSDNFFGLTVRDPYRYMEQTRAPEVTQWMKAQSDFAGQALARIPARASMLDSLRHYDEAVPARVAHAVHTAGDRWFFERRLARENQFKLYMRDHLLGKDKLLVDPEVLSRSTGKPHAIQFFSPSPNGRYLAYGVSRQGNESASLHVLDTHTGRPVGQPIARTNYGGVSWSPDSKTLLFNRLQLMQPEMPDTERFQRSRVWRLRVGANEDTAVPVFGTNTPGVQIRATEFPLVQLSHDGRWAIGLVQNGTQRELSVYVAPQASVLDGAPRWRKLLDPRAQVTSVSYFGDALYTLSHLEAPRSKISVLPLLGSAGAQGEYRHERVVVSQSDRVITGMATAADALYIEARDGNIKRLFKLAYAPGARVNEVRLPVDGAFSLQDDDAAAPSAADPRVPGLLLALESWTQARQIYQVSADGRVNNTGLQPAGGADMPTDLAVTEVRVLAADGAQIPMTLIHRKDLARNGNNPTLLYGYAAYGVTEEPFFSHSRLAWLDAGGIFAVANPRGSGVYGEDWYRAGLQENKHHSWEDFIACAQYLVAHRYTQPRQLGLLGSSAGGILVGRAVTERPELFGAAVVSVGALDMVRGEHTPNGVPNIPEFGTGTTEPGLRSRLAMSTYHQIRDGTPYPAVLLTHGVNDPRVEVWHSAKTAARLQAASTSGRPVLLRLDYDAGHGAGNTKEQVLRERADIFSFLLWQMGVPSFQPEPRTDERKPVVPEPRPGRALG